MPSRSARRLPHFPACSRPAPLPEQGKSLTRPSHLARRVQPLPLGVRAQTSALRTHRTRHGRPLPTPARPRDRREAAVPARGGCRCGAAPTPARLAPLRRSRRPGPRPALWKLRGLARLIGTLAYLRNPDANWLLPGAGRRRNLPPTAPRERPGPPPHWPTAGAPRPAHFHWLRGAHCPPRADTH